MLAGSLLYLQYVSYAAAAVFLVGLAVVATGLVMLQIVWLTGVLRPAANRIRPSSRPHLWLLRAAFIWLATAGVISIYVGARAIFSGALPTQLEFDAVRHALGQKDPYALFLQVLAEENASSEEKSFEAEGFKGDLSDRDAKREYIQKKLRRKHGLDAG